MRLGAEFEKITQLTPELEVSLQQRLENAVLNCRSEGEPLAYGNVVMAAMILGDLTDRSYGLVTYAWNEDLLYEYVKGHKTELGVRLYSEEVESYLEVEPGCHLSRYFRESVGYLFAERLPGTYKRIKGAQKKPCFKRLDCCERGIVAGLSLDDELIVVKNTLSSQESEIARELGKIGLAPIVFESTISAIAEEFILDPTILNFVDNPYFVGHSMGWIISELHKKGIIYNNRFFDHIFVGKTSGVRIIDLEAAYRGDNYSNDWDRARREINEIIFKDEESKSEALRGLNDSKQKF
jgi:hypothetical protein